MKTVLDTWSLAFPSVHRTRAYVRLPGLRNKAAAVLGALWLWQTLAYQAKGLFQAEETNRA